MAQLGVGRAAFREGIGILQRQGVVRSDAGPRGGLVVEAPPETAFSNLLRNHLELADVSFQELMLAHSILTHIAADLALARVTPARINDLRAALKMPDKGRASRDEQAMIITGFEAAMLRLANNPDLSHATLALTRLLADFGHQERYPKALWRDTLAHAYDINMQMLVALVERDPAIHQILDERYDYILALVEQLERHNDRIWNRKSFLHGAYTSALIGRDREQRAPLTLSYTLAAEIRRGEMAPGTRLGNEQEIAQHHGASRIVVIEALRMLEFLGIVRIIRGRSAGVEVIEPDATLVVQTAALYLEYLDGLPGDLHLVRRGLERGTMVAIADTLRDSAISPLAATARDFEHCPDDERVALASTLYRQLIALSGNRAIILLTDILAHVHRKHPAPEYRVAPERVADAAKELTSALSEPDGLRVADDLIALVHALDDYVRAHGDFR